MNNIPLLDRVKQDAPHWAEEKICGWNVEAFVEAERFVTHKYWSDRASINVFRVIGTQHGSYSGMTWREFLEKGKRMKRNLDLHSQNRGYYLETDRKSPAMYYLSLNGLDWFVADDGNHRTCIARFDFYYNGIFMLHGVTAIDYRVDWELLSVYRELRDVIADKGLRILVAPTSDIPSREDTAGWMLERKNVSLVLRDIEKGTSESLDLDLAKRKLNALSRKKRFWLFG